MTAMLTGFRRRAAVACLAVLAAVSFSLPDALAQESLVRNVISQDEAVAMVREQTGGKVVRVDRQVEGESIVYRIRVLKPDGRLREYRVDAATGRVR
jgi:uncharacterized membrane protein YkoI